MNADADSPHIDVRTTDTIGIAWVLRGGEVARGPDCEPLLRGVIPVALLDDRLLAEAADRYGERFDAGRGPED